MKKLLVLIMLLQSLSSFSQKPKFTKPDYNAIKKEIQDKNSPYFYEKLEQKFNQSDSTATIAERRHLYYGFIYQKKYASHYRSPANDSLRSVLKKEVLGPKEHQKIIQFGNTILEANPFDLRTMNYLTYAYESTGNMVAAKNIAVKMDYVIGAILSSGDGLTKENAFYVINVSHEYDIVNILGLQFGGSQSLVDGHYDYLKLAKNDYKVEGFYFDISPSLDKLSEALKD
jgi:hypothetical protein